MKDLFLFFADGWRLADPAHKVVFVLCAVAMIFTFTAILSFGD